MPFDPAKLRAELSADPLNLGYAPLLHVAADQAVADLLNALKGTRSAPVSLEDLERFTHDRGIFAKLLVRADSTPTDQNTTIAKYAATEMLQTFRNGNVPDVNVENPYFAGALAILQALGDVTPDQLTALQALANIPTTRAEALFGPGVIITASQVGAAR